MTNSRSTQYLQQLTQLEEKLAANLAFISQFKQSLEHIDKITEFVNSINFSQVGRLRAEVGSEDNSQAEDEKRTPKQILTAEYTDMKMGDAIAAHLQQSPQPLSLDNMVDEMFEAETNEEVKRIKQCLTSELQRAKGTRWENSGRGFWKAINSGGDLGEVMPAEEPVSNGVLERTAF